MSVSSRGQIVITDTNLGPLVSICAIIFFIAAVFSVSGRIFTRIAVARKPANDDYALLVALVRLLRSFIKFGS